MVHAQSIVCMTTVAIIMNHNGFIGVIVSGADGMGIIIVAAIMARLG
jgi:hypothetical protein